MARKIPLMYKYLRGNKSFPTVWCPGCGNGIVLGAIIRAVDELKLDRNQIAMVSGIGCASRMPVYVDFCTIHGTHGRAIPIATGLKLAKPKMKVIVVTGDGDAIAIGGNHFIHAARRNIELTVIVINNGTYGLTGGQYSPTTPTGVIAATSPYGNISQAIDICELARDAGSAFVARSTVYHTLEMQRFIVKALQKSGFSVIEVLSNCYTYYGRSEKMKSAPQMLRWYKENTVLTNKLGYTEDKRISRGIFVDKDIPGYWEVYTKLVKELSK